MAAVRTVSILGGGEALPVRFVCWQFTKTSRSIYWQA